MKITSGLFALFVVFSMGLFFAFKPGKNNTNGFSKTNLFIYQDSLQTLEFNKQWQQKINSGGQALYQLYTENAVKVSLDGNLLEGRNKISEYYKTQQYQIVEIETTTNIIAVSDSTVVYEMGHFMAFDKQYSHLILWRKEGKRLLRELELFAPKEHVENQKPQIDQRRTDWMAVCNAHNTEKLVTDYYSINALYYNHRPMIIGHRAIVEEYSYMNNPNYELTLNPIIFEAVNDSLAFEIGHCSGSYRGNYVLVWQKDESGEWRILFDSNI